MLENLPYPDAFWRTSARRFQQRRASKERLPDQESLNRIRKLRCLSQLEVAIRLETSQSEVSKLEHRPDLRVSTLRAYIEALGGSLDLVARFPGLHIRIRLGHP